MRNNINDGLHQTFTGQPTPTPTRASSWLVEGVILAVSPSTHTATYSVPNWNTDRKFVERPYGDGVATPPNVGDHCLIGFPGGIETGWILSWHTPG